MKTKFLSAVAIAAIVLASCESDDTSDIVINDNSVTTTTTTNEGGGDDDGSVDPTVDLFIGGVLTEDLTLEPTNDCYILEEALVMTAGTTLTIPAGTCIRANVGSDVYIAITQGARIIADGTSTNPIVLTSNTNTPQAGNWGGLILLGRAPINSVAGGNATSMSEIGQLPYGGPDASDDSGIVKYVRVEYSGASVSSASENNGFSFYGVGNRTEISYIQAFEGSDDGIEFFGGTVHASFISVIGAQDDSVDWTEGFSGTLTDVYIEHRQSHDKGIEGDGFNSDIGNNSDPVFFSSPVINNLTIIGVPDTDPEETTEAIRLRVGTRALFTNVFLQGFEEGFDLDDTETGVGVLNGETGVDGITFSGVDTILKNDTGAEFTEDDFFSNINNNNAGTDYPSWSAGWVRN